MSFTVAFHYSGASAVEMEFGSTAEAYVYLRGILRDLPPELPSWYSVTLHSSAAGGRIIGYDHRTNELDLQAPARFDALPKYMQNAYNRLIKELQKRRASAYVAQFLLQAHQDQERGGQLLEEDLRAAGFHQGCTKTHPGYWPRSERPLAECLEPYDGAYGVGMKEHIPRYDTQNYHFVKYWLLDLEADDYGTES